MAPPKVEARPAATVMLVRDGEAGIEVLLVDRPERGFFGGLTVFPGGAVDQVDRSRPDAVRVGEEPDAIFRITALRELAEETGLALTDEGVVAAPPGHGIDLFAALDTEGTRLDGSALTLVSRWVTPEEAPSRFDTCFFIAAVGATPDIRLDSRELVGFRWLDPVTALELERAGDLRMFRPTIWHLEWLSRWSDTRSALDAARELTTHRSQFTARS